MAFERRLKSLMKQRNSQTKFAVCVNNEQYKASLELRKIYHVIPDQEGGDYLVIEYLEGETLAQRCFASGPHPQPRHGRRSGRLLGGVQFQPPRYTGTFGDFDIFIMQLNARAVPGAAFPAAWVPGMIEVTGTPGPDMHARFSPDSKWLIFASARGGFNGKPPLFDAGPQPCGELWALRIAGDLGPIMRLTHNKWEHSLPDWGPKPVK